jgi:wyosine [tRNA(Phe)-imidazoG37] synthetase (radical SAM superfamily)
MACILFPSPIFGPVHSRRLGTSLGINLLPAEAKVCSFDCVYCECGFNKDHDAKRKLPTREEVRTALETHLSAENRSRTRCLYVRRKRRTDFSP